MGEIPLCIKQWRPCTKWNLGIAAGPYYYHRGCSDGIIGIKARLSLQFLKYLNIGGRFSYDNVFKDRFRGLIALTFPFGKTGRSLPSPAKLLAARSSCEKSPSSPFSAAKSSSWTINTAPGNGIGRVQSKKIIYFFFS